jgi:hypothetical protein
MSMLLEEKKFNAEKNNLQWRKENFINIKHTSFNMIETKTMSQFMCHNWSKDVSGTIYVLQ